MTFLKIAGLTALAAVAGIVACSSDSTTTVTATTAAAVLGEVDTHCNGVTVTVDPAACNQAAATVDAGGDDAGITPDDQANGDYGPTRFNAESDDDDCKYHVTWKSTPTGVNKDVTFTVVVTNKATGAAVTGANIRPEVFLDTTHPAPNSGEKSTESPAGTYSVGPIRFDATGRWNVRFHLFESCNDNEHSPHGHAAFYVTVP